MSVACGNCKGGYSYKLVCLYRLVGKDGSLQYPCRADNFFPPNSLVCEKCIQTVPVKEKYELPEGQGVEGVHFGYTPAEESGQALCGVISAENPENFTFIKQEGVKQYLVGALDIIQRNIPKL